MGTRGLTAVFCDGECRIADLKVEEPDYRKEARAAGRITSPPYTPVTLLAEFDLDNLPSSGMFLEVCSPKEEE